MTTREMIVACLVVLTVFAAGVGFGLTRSQENAWTIGGDFVEFYTAGRILNEHKGDRLYDLDLQQEINHELAPEETSLRLPFLYAPFIAVVFRPLALLSYRGALFVFLVATPVLYLGALILLNSRFGPYSREERTLTILAGLTYFAFLGYNWLGAQISVIGFAAIVVALTQEDRGRSFTSGLALSVCLYKPSLLVLILPMVIVRRSYRQLEGFATGSVVLAAASLWVAGPGTTLSFLRGLAGVVTQSAAAVGPYNLYRYVDLNAFFRLMPYGRSPVGYIVLAASGAAVAFALLKVWLGSRGADRPHRLLAWAATLTWTLVLNIYTPFYDAILAVAAAVLAIEGMRCRGWAGWNLAGPALLCGYLTIWIAEPLARAINVQVYTLVLGWFGTVLLMMLRGRVAVRRLSSHWDSSPPTSAI